MAETTPIPATPRIMNGCAWMATSPPSASPTTRRKRSATWCSSNCRSSAARSPPARPAPWWRASRRRPTFTRRSPARWWRPTQTIVDDPALVNSDAEGEGWFFRSRLDDTAAFDALMDRGRLRRIRGDAVSMDALAELAALEAADGFVARHIGAVGGRYRRDAARGRRGHAGRRWRRRPCRRRSAPTRRWICRRRSTRRR